MTFDTKHWQSRLDVLRAAHHVPGATLAVLVDGEIHELASGVLHRGTGVETTTDSLFQVGSVTKIHTATLVLRLVDDGELDLDAKVIDVLPDFEVADAEATRTVTVRQMLSHTSGISGDFSIDTGRGDDNLELYVKACAQVGQDFPPGTAISYCGVGYNVLGRIVEVLTGKTWDAAVQDLLCAPLGLHHTATLPEDVLRFRAAMSHLGDPGQLPDPAPAWNPLPRSSGPYGGILCSSAADLVRLARLHLDGGTAPDGTRVLSADAVEAMQRREVEVPDKWTVSSDAWGLGWTLYDWQGVRGFGHDGATIGQFSYLRVVPDAGVIAVLLTNGGDARQLYASLFGELLADLADLRMPAPFEPPARPPVVDTAPITGRYRREGAAITITETDGKPHLVYEFVDGLAGISPAIEAELIPLSDTVFAAKGTGSFSGDWMPVVFAALPTGDQFVYIGLRAAPKVA